MSNRKENSAKCCGSKESQRVQDHPAWCDSITPDEAKALLNARPPFTYLLGEEGAPDAFRLSFVADDGRVSHEVFRAEKDGQWCFLNGGVTRVPLWQTLIPKMMHCAPEEPTPFVKESGE